MPTLAAELVSLPVALLVVASASDALVVRQVVGTLPIVVAGIGDLVDAGLAASLARPGGSVTGLSTPVELRSKSIQLLMEATPGVAKVAMLADASAREMTALQGPYSESFGQRLGVPIPVLSLGRPDELGSVFMDARRDGIDALYVGSTPFTVAYRGQIIALAAEHHLPATYGRRVFVDDGGLMSYQPRLADLFRRSAFYVDRILHGIRPADLPVEQPREFDFVINLKTAQGLGLTIPEHVLLQATEVIQ